MTDAPVPVHVRTIRVEAVRSGEAELTVTGRLADERPGGAAGPLAEPLPRLIHDMEVTLRVSHPALRITEVAARMHAHPYLVCPEAVPPLEGLVGVAIGRGFTREVNERFGRARGCAHLTALIHAMAPVVRQAAGAAFPPDTPRDGAWWVDTCHAWRQDGRLHALLRRGDEAGLRAMATDPGVDAERRR